MTLDDLELAMILDSLKEHRESLRSYKGWIDDRPVLPAREVAIDQVNAQIRRILDLELRIYDEAKARISEGAKSS